MFAEFGACRQLLNSVQRPVFITCPLLDTASSICTDSASTIYLVLRWSVLVMAANPICSPGTEEIAAPCSCMFTTGGLNQRSRSLIGVFVILTLPNHVIVLQSERGLSKTSGCYYCRSASSTSGQNASLEPWKGQTEASLHYVSIMETE